MKKINDLKPYYMSLKIGPEAQPMNIGSITQVLGILWMFNIIVAIVSPSLTALVVCGLHLLVALVYIVFAIKNKEKLDDSYFARTMFTANMLVGALLMAINLLTMMTTVNMVLVLLVIASFLLGCIINYIVAVRYVSKLNNDEKKSEKTIGTGASVIMTVVIGCFAYPLMRVINPSKMALSVLIIMLLIFGSVLTGYLVLSAVGKNHFEKLDSEK